MSTPESTTLSARYTKVSDRFRSLWTFYQFLSGVLKHLGKGPLPYSYDFQGLHGRIKELVHAVGLDNYDQAAPELDQLERELDRIRRDLARIEHEFSPSVMRRFFDHIKRQDQKVLNALLKFYLQSQHYERDTLDKVDILCTRLAEVPIEDGRVSVRDPEDLKTIFERLFVFTNLTPLPAAEVSPFVDAVVSIRSELEATEDYPAIVESRVYERYRRLKHRLGPAILNPAIQVEVVVTNITAKNRFEELFRAEEARVAGNTNRILDIERYIDRHPELASTDLKEQIETFRRSRVRYESGLRSGNVRREDITEMTRAMHTVLERFDPTAKRSPSDAGPPAAKPTGSADPVPAAAAGATPSPGNGGDRASTTLADVLPLDPLLNETLHKIMFALEMVVWDRLPAQVTEAPEIRNLELESREIDTYRRLAQGKVERGTAQWELDSFFLASAALRVKMEDERKEIIRLQQVDNAERLFEVLERSAQSLERARDTDRRFQWFIDDMLFRGDTSHLEDIYRCRFRFLHAYSGLWLVHQHAGGLTPL